MEGRGEGRERRDRMKVYDEGLIRREWAVTGR